MEYHSSTSHRVSQPALICRICGDVARGMNFDVISCMSCKAFFRRHALKYTKKLQCPLNENCDITKISRGGCAACRLRKCFTIGMNPKLIRSCNKPLKLVALPQLKPHILLNHDRSTLTVDEWNLLSNIIHAYDEQEPVAHAKRTLQKQSILPAKLRTKKSSAFELISTMYTSVQPFIERSPYFRNMPADLRRIILQNNFAGVAGVNGCMIGAEADVFANEDYVNACNEIYGVEYVRDVRLSLKRYETNQNLLKLILIILTFSSNASVTSYDPSVVLTIPSYAQTLYLLRTQDMFITMLWKYIVYLYGYIDGIKKMNGLVKNLLETLDRIHAIASKQHWDMVDHIVEETFNSLSIDS